MGKPTFQRITSKRVQKVAPNLRFVAFYHREEERLNACMHDYEGRAFVYVLSINYKGQEYFLYVGKTKAQYARCLMHSKKYAYDYIYLFECEPEHLTSSEAAVIAELCPLYNRNNNPCTDRFRLLLDIDYNAVQNADIIYKHLERYAEYEKKGLFGFTLPATVFAVLEREAKVQGCNCSEMLQKILEKAFGSKLTDELNKGSCANAETNLITTKQYGQQHGRSREQVKVYLLQQDRIPGTAKVGRDWVIPRDAKFPRDMRGIRKSKKASS